MRQPRRPKPNGLPSNELKLPKRGNPFLHPSSASGNKRNNRKASHPSPFERVHNTSPGPSPHRPPKKPKLKRDKHRGPPADQPAPTNHGLINPHPLRGPLTSKAIPLPPERPVIPGNLGASPRSPPHRLAPGPALTTGQPRAGIPPPRQPAFATNPIRDREPASTTGQPRAGIPPPRQPAFFADPIVGRELGEAGRHCRQNAPRPLSHRALPRSGVTSRDPKLSVPCRRLEIGGPREHQWDFRSNSTGEFVHN
jgi:hypothetical protein